jgi:hypothetical protein
LREVAGDFAVAAPARFLVPADVRRAGGLVAVADERAAIVLLAVVTVSATVMSGGADTWDESGATGRAGAPSTVLDMGAESAATVPALELTSMDSRRID